jgi:hypothetical protein
MSGNDPRVCACVLGPIVTHARRDEERGQAHAGPPVLLQARSPRDSGRALRRARQFAPLLQVSLASLCTRVLRTALQPASGRRAAAQQAGRGRSRPGPPLSVSPPGCIGPYTCPAALRLHFGALLLPRPAAPLAGNSRANHPRWQRSGATAVVTGTGVATPTTRLVWPLHVQACQGASGMSELGPSAVAHGCAASQDGWQVQPYMQLGACAAA